MLSTKMIGNKIAEARKKARISQAQLAERLFISPQAVGKWERGESMPDITTFNRLAEILGVDLNYFSERNQSTANEITSDASLAKQSSKWTPEKQEKKLNWDMSRGNWVDADFSGLKNLQEKFSSSNLKNCKFLDSELSGLIFKSNQIGDCDFSNSDLKKSKIQSSELTNNVFRSTSLMEVEFKSSEIRNCDFTKANFVGAEFISTEFADNKIEMVEWKLTSFKLSHLANVVFDGTMKDCSFENCSFKGVKFQNATIINTFFKNNRKLNRVQFINCKVDNITYAFLKNGKADMTGITLFNP